MRKNKKAMLVLLSAAMLAGAVSGCSKSSKTEGKQHPQKHPLMQALKKQKQIQMERPLPMRAMVS